MTHTVKSQEHRIKLSCCQRSRGIGDVHGLVKMKARSRIKAQYGRSSSGAPIIDQPRPNSPLSVSPTSPVQAAEIRLPCPLSDGWPSSVTHCVPEKTELFRRTELAVVIATPIQAGVVARHGQTVHHDRGSVKFHGRLGWALGLNMSLADMDPTTRTFGHGVTVVHLKGRQRRVVVEQVQALKVRRSTELTAKRPWPCEPETVQEEQRTSPEEDSTSLDSK